MSYKNFPQAIFWYFTAIVPVYHCAKIHSLSSRKNFIRKCAFSDLADFWLIFRFFERIEVCAFISRKLNTRRGPFFIFPDNFTHSILIAKKYPTWGSRFVGYSDPKSVSEAKIWKLTLFHAAPATKRLDSEVQWCFILYARGSSSKRPYQILNDPYNIAPRKLKLLHPPKKFDPHFRQILRGRGQIFALIIRGRPRPVAENRFFFELREICRSKKSWQRGPKFTP